MGRKASYVRFDAAKPGEALAPALAAHLRADDDARPIEAVKRRDLPRAIDYGSEPERAQAAVSRALADRKAAKTGGRPPSQSVSALFAAPPPWESPEAWPLEKVNRWALRSNAWLRRLLPREAVTHTATLHTDERAPHLHITFVPVALDGKGVYSLSWRRVLNHMAEQAAGGRVLASPKVKMQALQDSYYRDVGQHFGMERGKRGRGIQYAPLDRAKGAAERIADTDARLEEERKAHGEAERRRVEADTARRQAETLLVAERDRAARSGRLKDEAYSDAIELADTAEVEAKTERARAAKAAAELETERTARTEAERRGADADAARQKTAAQLETERTARTEAERRRADAETAREKTAAQLETERTARTEAERRRADAETAREKTAAQLERERTGRTEAERKRADAETAREKTAAQLASQRRRADRAERREDDAYADAVDSLATATAAERRADRAEARTAAVERTAAASRPRGNPHRGAAVTARTETRTRHARTRQATPAAPAPATSRHAPAPATSRHAPAPAPPTPTAPPPRRSRR